jgi:hypothetical protein
MINVREEKILVYSEKIASSINVFCGQMRPFLNLKKTMLCRGHEIKSFTLSQFSDFIFLRFNPLKTKRICFI